MSFQKVTRKQAKLRMALTGVSGSGKTLGALYIAFGMTGDWGKIALIDTEHERARFYASRTDLPYPTGEFLYAPMGPPYSPEAYKKLVREAAEIVGADGVVIVDSLSHAWNQEGGVLDIKEKIAQQAGKNSYTAWNEAGKEQNSLINTVLAVPCHTIVTLRVKTEYAMEINDRGKQQPVKLGLAPVQRDDTEYELDIVLDINRNHYATASKDTTFLDNLGAVITPALGEQLAKWLEQGEEPMRCEACGQIITAAKGKSADELASGTKSTTGQCMCLKCFAEWQKQVKQRANERGDRLTVAMQTAGITELQLNTWLADWHKDNLVSQPDIGAMNDEDFETLINLIYNSAA